MADHSQPRYVVFNRETGAVIGTYEHFDAETGTTRSQPLDEILDLFKGIRPVAREPGKKSTKVELDVLESDAKAAGTEAFQANQHWVDPKSRRLVSRFMLKIVPGREALKGDGKDSVEISIAVVDTKGKAVKDFEGELLVTTTNGRLSTPGGRVKARGGKASITLTSTAETIHRVSLNARDSSGRCNSAGIVIEFV